MSFEETYPDGTPVLVVTEAPLTEKGAEVRGRWLRLTPFEPGQPWSLQVLDSHGKVLAGLIVSAEDIAATAAAVRNEELAQEAARLGAEQGRVDAGWVFDGNTPDIIYTHTLELIEKGDPVQENLERCLSDVDEDDILADLDLDLDDDSVNVDDLAEAWQRAQRDAFWAEVEKTAREHIAGMQGEDKADA